MGGGPGPGGSCGRGQLWLSHCQNLRRHAPLKPVHCNLRAGILHLDRAFEVHNENTVEIYMGSLAILISLFEPGASRGGSHAPRVLFSDCVE